MSDEYVKSEEILETRWKCPSCERVNRGRDMKCVSCGAPKDEASEYQIDPNAEVVADEEQLADAEAGEHWVCAYCEKENRGRKRVCAFCGADQTKRDRKQKAGPPPLPKKKEEKSNFLVGCVAILVVVGALVGLLAWWLSPRKIEATVVDVSWQQALHLQKKTLVHKEAWQDQVPGEAFDRSCRQRQRTTRQVVDHYRSVSRTRQVKYQSGSHEDCHTETKNMGNGYAKRQQVCRNVPDYSYRSESYTDQEPIYRTEPVYDDYCSFDLHEWPVVQTATRQGSGTSGLAWPSESEVGQSASCVPCSDTARRAGADVCCGREAHYRVVFQNPKKPEDKPIYEAKTPEEFATFALGQKHKLSIDDGKVTIVPPK